MAYNAHWGVGRRRALAGERFDVVPIIAGFGADVVVVPEAFRFPDGTRILDPLRDHGYELAQLEFTRLKRWRGPNDVRPEGYWELAICSRFPIVEQRALPIGKVLRDPAGPRHALECTLDVHGTAVRVVAVHTSSKLWFLGPVRHLRRLRRHLPPLAEPVIVAGDCNWWGPGVVAILRGRRRAVIGKTFPSHRPHSQIDHILVSDPFEVLGGEVLAATPSDHLPVRARLRLCDGE